MIPEFVYKQKDSQKMYPTLKKFKDAFKQSISNFDPSKIFFKKKNKDYYIVSFLVGIEFKEIEMYKCHESINRWKNHFESFIETGEWDNYVYWRCHKVEWSNELQNNVEVSVGQWNKVYAIRYGASGVYGDNFIFMKFLNHIRKTDGNISLCQVAKPDNNDDVEFVERIILYENSL